MDGRRVVVLIFPTPPLGILTICDDNDNVDGVFADRMLCFVEIITSLLVSFVWWRWWWWWWLLIGRKAWTTWLLFCFSEEKKNEGGEEMMSKVSSNNNNQGTVFNLLRTVDFIIIVALVGWFRMYEVEVVVWWLQNAEGRGCELWR